MEAKYEEITLGEPICSKIKRIFYHDEPWSKCNRKVAEKFSELKQRAKKFYPGYSIIEVLKQLTKYTEEDLKDMFSIEIELDVKKSSSQFKGAGDILSCNTNVSENLT